MALIAILPIALLGALAGLDVVSFPQAMISRPIVAATLGGALAGSTMSGLVAGVVLELIALETLPVGASRYPEWGSASVVGGALFAAHAGTSSIPEGAASIGPVGDSLPASLGYLLLATLGAIATAWAGGWSMYYLRRLNGRWATARRSELDGGSARTVIGLQLRGMCADLLRGALLAAIAFTVLDGVMRVLVAYAPPHSRIAVALAIAVAAGVGFSAVWSLTHSATNARWYFLVGLVIGLLLMVVPR